MSAFQQLGRSLSYSLHCRLIYRGSDSHAPENSAAHRRVGITHIMTASPPAQLVSCEKASVINFLCISIFIYRAKYAIISDSVCRRIYQTLRPDVYRTICAPYDAAGEGRKGGIHVPRKDDDQSPSDQTAAWT